MICKYVSELSDDPSTKVGSIAVRNKKIISVGYNHLPDHLSNHSKILKNRELKYSRIIHAEMSMQHMGDYTNATVYIYPLFSCDRCTAHLIHRGVSRIVSTSKIYNSKYSDVSESLKICSESLTDYTIYSENFLEEYQNNKLKNYVLEEPSNEIK